MSSLSRRLWWGSRVRPGVPSRAEFAVLAEPCKPDLLRLARRLARDDDRAQDLVQETLIRAFETYLDGSYQERGNLRAYLMRILTNNFFSERRRGKWDAGVDVWTVTSGGEGGPAQTHATGDDVPGHALWESALDEPLERALAALPDTLRATVLLVDVEGLEYDEAARALGVPIGTVRSRLFRARQLLHTRLLHCATERGWIER